MVVNTTFSFCDIEGQSFFFYNKQLFINLSALVDKIIISLKYRNKRINKNISKSATPRKINFFFSESTWD